MKFVGLALIFVLFGCSVSPKVQSIPAPKIETLDERRTSCIEIYDHLVDMAVNEYIVDENLHPGPVEYEKLRKFSSSQLEARGVDERFKLWCLSDMNSVDVACIRKAASMEAIRICAK